VDRVCFAHHWSHMQHRVWVSQTRATSVNSERHFPFSLAHLFVDHFSNFPDLNHTYCSVINSFLESSHMVGAHSLQLLCTQSLWLETFFSF
jgi:hypothetical protein